MDCPISTPHAFRHTAASTMIANGVDLVTTANELGHANATTTAMIYAHQIAIAKARAADGRQKDTVEQNDVPYENAYDGEYQPYCNTDYCKQTV